jgi:hypothetical protein
MISATVSGTMLRPAEYWLAWVPVRRISAYMSAPMLLTQASTSHGAARRPMRVPTRYQTSAMIAATTPRSASEAPMISG